MKLNVFTAICLTICTLSACNSNRDKEKEEEKAQLDSLLKVHDHLMDKNEKLLENKSRLDSLQKLYASDTAKVHQMSALSHNLAMADSTMEDWMHKFNTDYAGKPHDEIMNYLKSERAKITGIDAQLSAAVDTSTKYLAKTK